MPKTVNVLVMLDDLAALDSDADFLAIAHFHTNPGRLAVFVDQSQLTGQHRSLNRNSATHGVRIGSRWLSLLVLGHHIDARNHDLTGLRVGASHLTGAPFVFARDHNHGITLLNKELAFKYLLLTWH